MSRIFRFLRLSPTPKTVEQAASTSFWDLSNVNLADADKSAIYHPPFRDGIPLLDLRVVLARQEDLISQIRRKAGINNEHLYLDLILNVLKYVHMLPASENHHHLGTCGLFRHSLEVARYSMILSETVTKGINLSPGQRTNFLERWKLSSFVAGICHDLGKVVSSVVVFNEKNEHWEPFVESLWEWGQRTNSKKYFVRWNRSRSGKYSFHEKILPVVLGSVLPIDVKNKLLEERLQIYEELMDAVTLNASGDNKLYQILRKADSESVKKNLETEGRVIEGYQSGVPMGRYIFDGIKSLIAESVWVANRAGGPLWIISERMFLQTEKFGADLNKHFGSLDVPISNKMKEHSYIQILKDYDLLNLESCEDEAGEVSESDTWKISLNVPGTDISVESFAIELKNPHKYFDITPENIKGGKIFSAITGEMMNEICQHDTDDTNEDTNDADIEAPENQVNTQDVESTKLQNQIKDNNCKKNKEENHKGTDGSDSLNDLKKHLEKYTNSEETYQIITNAIDKDLTRVIDSLVFIRLPEGLSIFDKQTEILRNLRAEGILSVDEDRPMMLKKKIDDVFYFGLNKNISSKIKKILSTSDDKETAPSHNRNTDEDEMVSSEFVNAVNDFENEIADKKQETNAQQKTDKEIPEEIKKYISDGNLIKQEEGNIVIPEQELFNYIKDTIGLSQVKARKLVMKFKESKNIFVIECAKDA